jgi:hypothetical protein
MENKDKGIIQKYIISRTDGTPIDPKNAYFILKIEGNGDPEHINASRIAVCAYADAIKNHLPELSKELIEKYELNRLSRPVTDDEIDAMFPYEKGMHGRADWIINLKREGAKALRDRLKK